MSTETPARKVLYFLIISPIGVSLVFLMKGHCQEELPSVLPPCRRTRLSWAVPDTFPVSDKLGFEGNAGLGGRDWVNGRVLSLGPRSRHHDS